MCTEENSPCGRVVRTCGERSVATTNPMRTPITDLDAHDRLVID
jgi:hypothetical protein